MAPTASYRHPIDIQENRPTQPSFGEPVDAWVTVEHTRASIEPMNGRELMLARQVYALATHKVELRYTANAKTTNRIKFGTRTFDINHVGNPGERNRQVVLTCQEA